MMLQEKVTRKSRVLEKKSQQICVFKKKKKKKSVKIVYFSLKKKKSHEKIEISEEGHAKILFTYCHLVLLVIKSCFLYLE